MDSDIQPRLSRSELLAFESDVDFAAAVINDIWAFPWPEAIPEYVAFFRGLIDQQRWLWATWIVQQEVDNGGFGQYIANIHDQVYLDEALVGFDKLGAPAHRAILQEVLNYMVEHHEEIQRTSLAWDEYIKTMGFVVLDERLNKIHKRFYDMHDELYAKRRCFIMQNLDLFTVTP